MTKIEQLEATINQAQKELQELKAEQAKKIINYFQPKENEDYWYVETNCKVCKSCKYVRMKRYRVFKTPQEAEQYAEYVKAEETLREAIAIANEGWLPDWNENIQSKYYISFSENNLEVYGTYSLKQQPNFMFIKSQELAEKLMEDYEQEFMTYLSY